MRSNEIELFAQIRQRLPRIDSGDDAADAEELGRPAEKRFVVGIEPETFVAEQTAKVEKISGAAAKIQDVERRCAIKPKVLYALYVNAYPIVGVLVSVDLSRVRPIRIMLAQSHQLRSINCGEDAPRTHRVRPTASVFQQAFRRVAGKELLKFLRKSHGKTMQKRSALLKKRRVRPLSFLYAYSNQTRRALPGHKSASPAVARIEVLFIAPQHL